MSAMDNEPLELVTLRAGMSSATFNRLLNLVQAEYPEAEPVPDNGVVHVMSRPRLVSDRPTAEPAVPAADRLRLGLCDARP